MDTILTIDGQTDGRRDGLTDKLKPVYPPVSFIEAGRIKLFQNKTIWEENDK